MSVANPHLAHFQCAFSFLAGGTSEPAAVSAWPSSSVAILFGDFALKEQDLKVNLLFEHMEELNAKFHTRIWRHLRVNTGRYFDTN